MTDSKLVEASVLNRQIKGRIGQLKAMLKVEPLTPAMTRTR